MKTNLSIAIIFLFALQLSAEKKPKLSISFEKRVAVFEAGEPISINCKFRNRTSDTLSFEEDYGLASWIIYKGWKEVLPALSMCGSLDPNIEEIFPNENKFFLGDPTDRFRFNSGVYFVRAIMRDRKGNKYRSNLIQFIMKKGNRSTAKAAEECSRGDTFEIQIQKSLAFLEKYKKSHFRDDVVFHMADLFEEEKKYDEAINVLKEFERADFSTSFYEKNGAFLKIANNYKTLGKYEEAISYLRKRTDSHKSWIANKIIYLQRDIEKKKNHPYWISFEGGLNEFEMGEPIKINSTFRNLTSDTLYFLEPVITYADWEILKNGEKVNPYIVVSVAPMIYPTIGLSPNESRKMLGAPNNAYRFESGRYVINAVLSDTFKNVYRSNKLSFKIKQATEEVLNDLEYVRFSSSTKNDIKFGLHFLEKYPTSHFRDEVILETGYALYADGQYEKAISLFEEFNDPHFPTTDYERSYAFLRLGQVYFKIEEYEKAIHYFKKIPESWEVSELREAQQKLNEKKN